MRTKQFNKKLVLNKKTVANLNAADMAHVKGGETGLSCPVCDTIVSCYQTHCKTCLTLCVECFTEFQSCPDSHC